MTTMGAAIANGCEISSIRYGCVPPKPSQPPPPVSIKGEWGILQRESRRGAHRGPAELFSREESFVDATAKPTKP